MYEINTWSSKRHKAQELSDHKNSIFFGDLKSLEQYHGVFLVSQFISHESCYQQPKGKAKEQWVPKITGF